MKRGLRQTTGSVLVAAALLTGLSGCVPLVVGGGAMTAALMASDRRTTGMQVEDTGIEQRAASRLRESFDSERGRVSVTSFNRLVLLTGEVRSAQDKQAVEQIVRGVENVSQVVNELEVVPFISSLAQRTKDTFITSKVKASLLDAKDLQANAIKVVTEMNVVYLMGIVTPREAKRAAEIARGVNDVRKVVRVFQNISEDDLANYNSQPAPVTQDSAASVPLY